MSGEKLRTQRIRIPQTALLQVDKFKLAVDSPGAASAPSPSAVSQLPPEGGRLPLRDPTPLSIRERTAAWVPELPASFPAAELSPVLPKTQPQPPLGPGQNEGDEGQAASDLANVAEGGHDGAVGVVLAPVADSEPHATLSQSAASVGGALTPRSEAARPAPAPVIPGLCRSHLLASAEVMQIMHKRTCVYGTSF